MFGSVHALEAPKPVMRWTVVATSMLASVASTGNSVAPAGSPLGGAEHPPSPTTAKQEPPHQSPKSLGSLGDFTSFSLKKALPLWRARVAGQTSGKMALSDL
jgi:hypothetical protein